MAGRIRAASRASDVVGRYGGEEFALLLPDTDLHGAVAAAEKLRRVIAAAPVNVPAPPGVAGSESGSVAISVRISAGAATRAPEMLDPQALYAAADGALYRAKRSGRDQVAVAEP